MTCSDSRRQRLCRTLARGLGVVALVASVDRSAHAATTPACDQAIERYEKQYGDRSDDEALDAIRALQRGDCAKPGAALSRALGRQGWIFYQRHDLRASTVAYEESVRLRPDEPELRMSLCGVYMMAGHLEDAIKACKGGLELAKSQDDGTAKRHDKVLRIGYNLALAKMKRGGDLCSDHGMWDMLEAFRSAHPEDAWVHQGLGAWVWDCDHDFDRGFALYKKSCALGQESACEQVRYTEQCMCKDRLSGDR
jgi:tetratricopeptide (TPR) repeat protein